MTYGAMDPVYGWEMLESLDKNLVHCLRKHFVSPLHLSAAIHTEEDSKEIVDAAFGGHFGLAKRNALGKALYEWASGTGPSAKKELSLQRIARELGADACKRQCVQAADAYEELVNSSPNLGLAALQKFLSKRAVTSNKAEKEDARKKCWALRLAAYIQEADLPVCQAVSRATDQNAMWCRAFGSRRANTLKNRAALWERFRTWLQTTYGRLWPLSSSDLLEYLEEKNEIQSLGKTVPSSLLSSLILLETVGQVAFENKISEDSLLTEAVKSWTTELETDAPPRRQAQMFSVAILVAAELMVEKGDLPIGLRIYAFILLLMSWGTLRCDDLQNIDPKSCVLSQLGLRFVLRRTKTTGPGKSVGSLNGFIARMVSLTGVDWLRVGTDLIDTSPFSFKRDFFAMECDNNWDLRSQHFLEPEGVSNHLRALLKVMPTPIFQEGRWILEEHFELVPGSLATFWTGHSARHTLPSIAAACGVVKDERDYLGRWACAKHGSQDYILTSRQVVHSIQNRVCKFLLAGDPAPGLIEEELHLAMQGHVLSAGENALKVKHRHKVLKWNTTSLSWSLGGEFPLLLSGLGDPEPEMTAPVELKQPASEDGLPDAPYFITISRKHFRRLHMSKHCAVRQERCLTTVPLFQLTNDVADAICKLCRPKIQGKMDEDSSESIGSSEDPEEVPEDGPEFDLI